MKKLQFLFFAVIILFPVAASAQQAQAKPFTWSLALQNVKTGDMIAFSSPVQSWTGEQFRIIIEPDAACFAYVIYEGPPPGGDMVILYSGSLKAGESWHSQVLELSPPKGSENFYVVVTRDEQKNLAARIAAFNASSASAQKRALMNEVYRVRRDVSQFKEAPEKPVLMGGAARGAPERSQGVAFSGLSAYVKTISIEH